MEIKNRLCIDLEPGQKLFFTSDLHFGHRNILTFCSRPFNDVKEMSTKLIEYWNETVSNNDIVVSLGDFSWWDSNTEIRKILSKLNGKKIYLIPGNHDTDKGYRSLPENVELLGSTVQMWVRGLTESNPNKVTELFLCHYPMMTYPHRNNGVVQLFGHIHSNPVRGKEGVDQDLPLYPGQQYDVGVDNNNYRPVEIRTVFEKLGKDFK